MMKNQLLGSVAVASMLAATSAGAQSTQYSDDVNWSMQKTTERANVSGAGSLVGDVLSPGYNPNTLRPSGDGFGRHIATEDVDMQGHNVTGVNEITDVTRIVGNGALSIENLATPSDPYNATNKIYVDDKVANAKQDLNNTIAVTQGELDNLTGGDGIDRHGSMFDLDETAVRTYGDQNISGVKNFQTRINVVTPVYDVDAVNKAYVDALIAQLREEILADAVTPPNGMPFLFQDIDPVILRQTIYTKPATVVSTPSPVILAVSGDGNPRISVNGGAWVTSATIENGDEVQARVTTGNNYSETFVVEFEVDGQSSSDWSVTTGANCLIDLVGMQCTDGTAYAGELSTGERWYLDTHDHDNDGIYEYQEPAFTIDSDRSTVSGYANTYNSGAGLPAAAACKARGAGWFLPGIDEWLSVYKTNGHDELWEYYGINRFEGRDSGTYDIYAQAPVSAPIGSYNDTLARADFESHYWTSTESAITDNQGTGRAIFIWKETSGNVYAKSARLFDMLSNPQQNKDYEGRVRCARVDSGVTPSLYATPRSSNYIDGTNSAQFTPTIND